MIKYEWRDSLTPDESAELAALLQRAAEYDAEAEYSTIDFADVADALSRTSPTTRHLLIWMLPYATAMGEPDQPERIAGLLRLTVDPDGSAEAGIVIDPRLRSIGITTLLLERIGLDTSTSEGWIGSGAHTVTAWARGNHQAAGRIGDRFLIPRTRRVWKLIRSTESVEDAAAAPVLEPLSEHLVGDLGWSVDIADTRDTYALREAGRVAGVAALDMNPVVSEEFGRCATVRSLSASPHADVQARRRLFDGAAAVAHDAGLTGLIIYVDSDDTDLVNACRLACFQHDRTDVRFQFGGSR